MKPLFKPLAKRDPFRVGMATLVVGVLLVVGIVVLSLASFGTTTYTAILEHSAGLQTGEDVQVHGVSSGKVTDVGLRESDVIVTFELDQEIELGSESTAEVKVATLLGTHYLQVEPEGTGELADGQIPKERTDVPYNLQDVLEEGTERLEELDPVVLADALSEISKTLGATSDEIGPALESVGRLSQLVTTRSAQTGDLLRAARGVSDQLADSTDDLTALMEATNLVAEEVTSRRAAIERLFRETTTLSVALRALVEDTDEDIGPALRDLDLALDALNRQDKQLRQVLEVMAPAFRYVANATGNGPFADLYLNEPALPADDQQCQTSGGC